MLVVSLDCCFKRVQQCLIHFSGSSDISGVGSGEYKLNIVSCYRTLQWCQYNFQFDWSCTKLWTINQSNLSFFTALNIETYLESICIFLLSMSCTAREDLNSNPLSSVDSNNVLVLFKHVVLLLITVSC